MAAEIVRLRPTILLNGVRLTEDQVLDAVEDYRLNGRWWKNWGPRPGHTGCFVPPRLLPHSMRPASRAPRAQPFTLRSPAEIPPRSFVYGQHLARGFVSCTIAPGGVGKSTLVTAEALALATGRPLLGIAPPGPLRVWLWNGEDPPEEIERKIAAACIHYGITAADLGDRLHVSSGRDVDLIIARSASGFENGVDDDAATAILGEMVRRRVDVLIADPFVATHAVSENNNNLIAAVGRAWGRVAGHANAAVELVHHVRKSQGGPGDTSVEDGRGAIALRDAVRSARVLNIMSRDEADRAGVRDARGFFRSTNGKANLAPGSDTASWFRLVSVEIGNGDDVGVVVPWHLKEVAAEIAATANDEAATIRRAVSEGGPWRENWQSGDWAGKPIATALGLDLGDKLQHRRVRELIRAAMGNGLLETFEGEDQNRVRRTFVRARPQGTEAPASLLSKDGDASVMQVMHRVQHQPASPPTPPLGGRRGVAVMQMPRPASPGSLQVMQLLPRQHHEARRLQATGQVFGDSTRSPTRCWSNGSKTKPHAGQRLPRR